MLDGLLRGATGSWATGSIAAAVAPAGYHPSHLRLPAVAVFLLGQLAAAVACWATWRLGPPERADAGIVEHGLKRLCLGRLAQAPVELEHIRDVLADLVARAVQQMTTFFMRQLPLLPLRT